MASCCVIFSDLKTKACSSTVKEAYWLVFVRLVSCWPAVKLLAAVSGFLGAVCLPDRSVPEIGRCGLRLECTRDMVGV